MDQIRFVKFFQCVDIEGKNETSVSFDLSPLIHGTGRSTEILITEVPNGLKLQKRGSKKYSITSWNNVQYISYEVVEVPKATKGK